jgi:hypothetical protein
VTRAVRPHPEERACEMVPPIQNRRVRVSKDEDARLVTPSCFETHRSAVRLQKQFRSCRAARLLSMRAGEGGAARRSEPTSRGEQGSNLRVVETAVIFGINRNLQAGWATEMCVNCQRAAHRAAHSSAVGGALMLRDASQRGLGGGKGWRSRRAAMLLSMRAGESNLRM